MAHNFATAAIDGLLAGERNKVVTFKDGHIGSSSISEIAAAKHLVNPSLVKLCEELSN
jgi:hypothetical protein